ncbi:hypothetical protein, partial [Variovorax sp. WDL1]
SIEGASSKSGAVQAATIVVVCVEVETSPWRSQLRATTVANEPVPSAVHERTMRNLRPATVAVPRSVHEH